ncbi:MAG: 2Fe-2S iron-sulfur cluster-binding protein [Pseudomonadota bacterium]
MREIILQIDGKEVKAREGITVLEAARSADIFIPTLCHNEKLTPYGGCRLCTVEVGTRGRSKFVASCLYPVEQDLVVRTRSEMVDKIRKLILEFLLAHAPDSDELKELAKTYGADTARFEKEAMFCILCGLCVRYCAEIKKKNVIGFVDRGGKREISFIPELAAKECWDCKECYPLCPTSYLQATYHLTEAIAFPWLLTQRASNE